MALPLEPAFTLQNVSFAYGEGLPALCNVSLDIAQGERVAILGANGCGKSALLRIMDALLFPSQGIFRAFGETITEKHLQTPENAYRFRRRVGCIFQNADAQLFSPTVREEIAFAPLQMRLLPGEIEQRILDVARLLSIENLLDRAPFQLSGGEKRKVAIASVLIINPDALLLDEPTTALDPRAQQELIRLMQNLHAAGKTLVTATHDLDTLPKIADRCFVFTEAHTLACVGETSDILANKDLLRSVNLIA